MNAENIILVYNYLKYRVRLVSLIALSLPPSSFVTVQQGKIAFTSLGCKWLLAKNTLTRIRILADSIYPLCSRRLLPYTPRNTCQTTTSSRGGGKAG